MKTSGLIKPLSVLVTVFVILSASIPSRAQVNVTTWHNDNWRTGQNTQETALRTSNVNKTQFGLICRISVAGQIFGQPLVVSNANGGGMTAYVVTMQDYVYAFNIPANLTSQNCPSNPTSVNLLQSYPAEHPADCCYVGSGQTGSHCQGPIVPTVGVLGTPVIDLSSNTLYLVAESQVGPATGYNPNNCQSDAPPTSWVHRLHALDLANLSEKYNGPAQVPATNIGSATFQSHTQIQRPGLLLLPSGERGSPTIYAAFSMMDGSEPLPNGWIFAYHAQDLLAPGYPLAYTTTPGNGALGGGIWQGGAGLAAGQDASGTQYLYFSTGDGVFDLNKGGQDASNSFVKLTTDLRNMAGYFTPSDQCYRQWADLDFGSGGVLLIPDGTLKRHPFLAVKADKENYIWVMDRTDPGGFNRGQCQETPDCTKVPRCLPSQWHNGNLETLQASNIPTRTRSAPAFWNGNLYLATNFEQLKKYPLGGCGTNPICKATAATSEKNRALGYAATPSISSDPQNNNGIVWAVKTGTDTDGGLAAVLLAFDATNLSELYNSRLCPTRDLTGPGNRFAVPTVANGYVLVGTQTDFDIFGPTTTACN